MPSTLLGRWWLPASPEKQVGGVLDFSLESGGVLRLHGGLVGGDDLVTRVVILGSSEEYGRITIGDASYAGQSRNDSRVERETWRCSTVLLGAHFETGLDTPLTTVTLSTQLLSWWTMQEKPKLDHGLESGIARLELQVPATLSAEIDGGRVLLRWRRSATAGLIDANITLEPVFECWPANPIPFYDAWRSFVTPILFLTIFATGHADRIVDLHVSVQDQNHEPMRSARVLVDSWSDLLTTEPPSNWWTFPLPFKEVEARFHEIIPSWFRMYMEARTGMLEYFVLRLTSQSAIEHWFSSTVRALELWHRALIGGKQMSEGDYQALLSKVEGVLGSEEWRLAKMRLKYGNELTQKQRLDDLVWQAEPLLSNEISSYRRFTRRVVDMRNQLMHGNDDRNDRSYSQMVYASIMLDAVFFAVLLRRLGFNDTEVSTFVKRHAAWRQLSSTDNVWLAEARRSTP